MLGNPSRPDSVPSAVSPVVGPVVSVVLCVRNGERTVAGQLDALRAQDYGGSWELVLVDNASTDGTRRLLEERATALPACQVLAEPRVGLNVGRNLGIATSHAAKIAMCDADDEVAPDWLRHLVDALDRFDVVGGALEVDYLNGASARHASHNQTTELPRSLGQPYAVGANLGFAKRVWEAIDGFDERFAGGCDETDFCLRAQDVGFTIGFAPTAVVHYRLRTQLDRIVVQQFGYGRGAERLHAKRRDLGAEGGPPAQRWRVLAGEARDLLFEAPAMLAHREERRRCVERTAWLAGRMVELLSPARGREGAADDAVSRSA